MIKKVRILVLLIPVLLIACTKSDDEKRKLEEESLRKQMDNSTVQLYKSIKVALRSTTTSGKNPELDSARNAMFSLVGRVLIEGYSLYSESKPVSTRAVELYTLGKQLYKVKDVLLKTEEDSLPTILSNIMNLLQITNAIPQGDYFAAGYSNNDEHVLLSVLWTSIPPAPKDIAMYEMYRSDEKGIKNMELAALYGLAKSMALYENGYFYLSFDQANAYLAFLETNKNKLVSSKELEFIKEDGFTNENMYYQLHGFGVLVRALDERKMGKDKEYLDDLELFLAEMQKGGVDNESTWTVAVYVHIQKDEFDKAIPYLEKLQNSSVLGTAEKEAFSEILTYAKARKKDAALNCINDKLAFGKIFYHFVKTIIDESKVVSDLDKSKQGQCFKNIPLQVNDKLQYVNEVKNPINTDSLEAKGNDLIKKMLK